MRCFYSFFNSTGGRELLDWHKVGRCGLEMFAVSRWKKRRMTERHMEGEGKRERKGVCVCGGGS